MFHLINSGQGRNNSSESEIRQMVVMTAVALGFFANGPSLSPGAGHHHAEWQIRF